MKLKFMSNFFDKDVTARYENGDHLFFTSDTHFNHANIIRFCNRPFKDVDEMNDALIKNWNDTVSNDDIIFHLGDFAWGGSDVWNSILKQLNGHKILILGNHDMKNLRQGYMKYFDEVCFQQQILIGDRSVYLNHYPFLTYGGIYRSPETMVYQLFGHVHTTPGSTGHDIDRMKYLFPTQYDVGVDNNNYKPISWDEAKRKIESQISESLK